MKMHFKYLSEKRANIEGLAFLLMLPLLWLPFPTV
jgi:hypothetical protein